MSKYAMDHVGIAMNIINGRPLTESLLEQVLTMLSNLDSNLGETELKRIRSKLESTIGIQVSVGGVVREDAHEPWLLDQKGTIEWHYWDSYKRLLVSQGWSPAVVRVLDEDTDNIITECGNPSLEEGWNIRGLVMGDVQSGKTASYSGVIAKAADAGYKVIVLLTGMIEDLRKQSQERLDFGFVGRDSRDVLGKNTDRPAIGAGNYRSKSANVLTSVDSDFLTANAQVLGGIPLKNINEPILFVIKKNVSPLKNLNEWLTAQMKISGLAQHHVPLLVIDDEADNASVNVKKEDEDPAKINAGIRDLLKKFSRSSYVAYTATPFANIFINPDREDDLFPSNFIYSLNTPSNYIGASSIFLEEGKHHAQLRDIDDAEEIIPHAHKKELPIDDIPESLKEAVRVFLISCAIRDIREEELRHRSMLVNVSRFTDVQKRISEKVGNFLWNLQEEIRQYLSSISWKKHSELVELKAVFEDEYANSGVTWDEIRAQLNESVASIKVVTINQKSAPEEKLDYSRYKNTEKGRRVIAIGGLTLSRGLTLEGLSVSYFYRNSKAYDTLLQMGRWFGYRPGYDDLFRIWMNSDAQNWYAHIANAVAELRTDFRRMSADRLPPSRFGIRVKAHPDTLIVTAQNKMRTGQEFVHSISFSGAGIETAYVVKDQLNQQNIQLVKQFIKERGTANVQKKRYFWRGVKKQAVAQFLAAMNISNLNMQFIPDETGGRPLLRFIEENLYPALENWDICIPQGEADPVDDLTIATEAGVTGRVSCRKRQFEQVQKGAPYLKLNKQRVGDTSDEKVGMSDPEINAANEAWRKEREKDTGLGESVPGYMYRQHRPYPLLTIHFLRPGEPSEKTKAGAMMDPKEVGTTPIVALSISFPDFDPGSSGQYVVYRLNKVALRDLIGDEGNEDDDTD